MNIDEAITHAREVAEGCPAEDRQCAYQHDELAEWLEELKAYKATGLKPEEITVGQAPCVFYCNRKCNLDGDWCAEGPGCPKEVDKETAIHLLKLFQAEKSGRVAVFSILT